MSETSILELEIADDHIYFNSNIKLAYATAKNELINYKETIKSIEALKPNCDRLDYILSAACGALCGIIDIFLVGKPGESPLGNFTDKLIADKVMSFAKLCGWNAKGEEKLSSAINFLEKKFKIPYDQRGAGDAASSVFGLNPTNHHFKSLGHNPSILGLFFSILDQFTNQSHFVSGGELISLQEADGSFELRGNSVPAKLFCGFANWIGHLISDTAGASTTSGRGMGIPSPFWTWTNEIIALKRKLNISVNTFDKNLNKLALKIYEKGFDSRFTLNQAIPLLINELVVRLIYTIRRLVKYLSDTKGTNRNMRELWAACEPFSNPTVKRMLTVAHGTFCLVDISDAIVRGFTTGAGSFNAVEFALRLNIVGVGRFCISLYGETKRFLDRKTIEARMEWLLQLKKRVVEDYINGLIQLSDFYNDKYLIGFVNDLRQSNAYQAFDKSIDHDRIRGVPEVKILKTKDDIDRYFRGAKK